MVCKTCFKFDKDVFEHRCTIFENWHSLMLFLLNIILNIKKKWEEFCICDGINICLVCQLNTHYFKYEHIIYKNCFNLDFLSKVWENIISNLHLLLQDDGHFVYQIINEKYQYHHVDWFTGMIYILTWKTVCLNLSKKKKKSNQWNN